MQKMSKIEENFMLIFANRFVRIGAIPVAKELK